MKDYLKKHSITDENKLALHIEELKRNTVVPSITFELVDLLLNKKDLLYSFFAPQRKINSMFLDEVLNDLEQDRRSEKHINSMSTRHKSRYGETHIHSCTGIQKDVTKFDILELGQILKQESTAVTDWKYYNSQQDNNDLASKFDTKNYPLSEPSLTLKGLDFNFIIEEGTKYNEGKPQLSILLKQFPDALKAITKCAEYGHNKYNDNGQDNDYLNFKRVRGGSKTYIDAGLRHLLEEGNDLGSKLPHIYHHVWNTLAYLQLWIEENNVKIN